MLPTRADAVFRAAVNPADSECADVQTYTLRFSCIWRLLHESTPQGAKMGQGNRWAIGNATPARCIGAPMSLRECGPVVVTACRRRVDVSASASRQGFAGKPTCPLIAAKGSQQAEAIAATRDAAITRSQLDWSQLRQHAVVDLAPQTTAKAPSPRSVRFAKNVS